HRGNLDALFPNTPEARGRDQKAPFLPEPERINILAVPEFLGAGDFNADGHWDLVVAARGGHVISYLLGDGKGHFDAALEVEAPGAVSALVTGDVNRPDGLADVVVAIGTEQGSKLLIFE